MSLVYCWYPFFLLFPFISIPNLINTIQSSLLSCFKFNLLFFFLSTSTLILNRDLAASYIATINNFFFRKQNNYTRNLTGTKYILKFWDLAAMGIRLIHMCWRNRIIRHQQACQSEYDRKLYTQSSFLRIYIYIYLVLLNNQSRGKTRIIINRSQVDQQSLHI